MTLHCLLDGPLVRGGSYHRLFFLYLCVKRFKMVSRVGCVSKIFKLCFMFMLLCCTPKTVRALNFCTLEQLFSVPPNCIGKLH